MTVETMQEVRSYPFERPLDLTVPEFYRELQRKGPFKVQLPFGEPIWLVTSYDDAKLVYGDKRFGKELGHGREPLPSMHGHAHNPNMIANMDPPRQTRIRRLALSAFSPGRTRQMTGWIEGMSEDLLDRMAASAQPADYIDLYAWTLPLKVITGILGVSEEDIPTFRVWVDDLTGPHSSMERRGECWLLLVEYICGLVAERREHPTEDLLSDLVHARDDDDRLSEDELVNLAMTLLLGGFETTAAQIGSTVFTLMKQRDLWEELLETPELVPNALEELWRWIPSFRFGSPMIRFASEDVELSGGVVIPAGDPLLVEHQVANRDEAVFPHADTIDFHRVDPAPHLSFAWGAHRCLGAHLAHLEIETSVRTLLERFPDLRLAISPEDVPWSDRSFLRSPAQLPLEW